MSSHRTARTGLGLLPLLLLLLALGAAGGASPTYAITFHETGLKAGTDWTVQIEGTTRSSTGSTVVFDEPPGIYNALVLSPPGYEPNQSTFSINVFNAPVGEYVSFNASSAPSGGDNGSGGGSGEVGPPGSPSSGIAPGVLIGIVVVAALGAVAFLFLSRKRPGYAGHPEPDESSTHLARHGRRSAKAAARRGESAKRSQPPGRSRAASAKRRKGGTATNDTDAPEDA